MSLCGCQGWCRRIGACGSGSGGAIRATLRLFLLTFCSAAAEFSLVNKYVAIRAEEMEYFESVLPEALVAAEQAVAAAGAKL